MKKLALILCSIFIIAFTSVNVNAAPVGLQHPKYSVKPTIGTESKDPTMAKGYITAGTTTGITENYIANPMAVVEWSIERRDYGGITGFAEIDAVRLVDQLDYQMEFQMWDGYEWTTVAYANNVAYFDYMVYGYHYRRVQPGKYYRLHIVYHVKEGYSNYYDVEDSDYIYMY